MLLASLVVMIVLGVTAFALHLPLLGWAAVAIALLTASVLTQPYWMPRSWYRALLYPGGRPTRLARLMNAESAWMFSRGIFPEFMVMFETRGRRTGQPHRIPLVVASLNGSRYLVSMLGENVNWVRNVRAANGEALLNYGKVEEVSLREIPTAERAPILKAYLARAPGGRPHFDIDWNAPLAEFERVAPRYPVFEVLPRAKSH